MVAEKATSLRRGLAILLALEEREAVENGGLGVSRLAVFLGCDKSQVSRSLKVLGAYGLVDRDPETLAYRLGWRILSMAGRSWYATIVAAADPLLKRLARELGERAHLSVLQGSEVVTILSEAPERAVQTIGWVGRTVPVHSTSAGRALLLDHSLDELAALLGDTLVATTPNAPPDVKELHARIVAAKERGYACVDEEFEAGLIAAAAPVRDFAGRIVAAVNVSAPKFRFGGRIEGAGALIKVGADELSAILGWAAADAAAEPGAPRGVAARVSAG